MSPALHGERQRSPSTPHSLLRPCTVSRGQRSTVVLSSFKKQKTTDTHRGRRRDIESRLRWRRTLSGRCRERFQEAEGLSNVSKAPWMEGVVVWLRCLAEIG